MEVEIGTLANTDVISVLPKPVKTRKIMFAIPSLLDTTESTLKNIAYTMIIPSIVQMLRSTIFIYCALLGVYFLKKRLYKHHWTSMGIIITGIVLVGVAFFVDKDKRSDTYTIAN